MTGADAAAASGGRDGGVMCTIPCLAELVRDCVPAGVCVQQGSVLSALNTCYANGVKTTLMFGSEAIVITYRNPDGQVCYSIESVADAVTQSASYVYKDASGAVIGEGAVDAVTKKFSFSCDGQSYDLGQSGCGSLPPTTTAGGGSCSEGACEI